jgi:hypothetical protein
MDLFDTHISYRRLGIYYNYYCRHNSYHILAIAVFKKLFCCWLKIGISANITNKLPKVRR